MQKRVSLASVPRSRIVHCALLLTATACSGQSGPRGSGPGTRPAASAAAASELEPTQKREVACGGSSCDVSAGQICCAARLESQQDTCIPEADAELECAQTRVHCDDSGDCPAGQACCYTFDQALDTHYVCGPMPCARGHEMCTAGECAHGFSCHGSPTSERKRCHFAGADVACGSSRCRGATPVCAYVDPDQPSCIPREESYGMGNYECDDRADCGPGYVCVLTPFGSSCMGPDQYDTTLTNATITCAEDADCPTTAFGELVCRAYDGLHSGLRGCLPPE